jgi:S1-C subfamily serine protease
MSGAVPFPGRELVKMCHSVEIPTAEARSCIRFKVVPTGPAEQAIVVEAVADGSSAAQAGIERGMKLTAISDPVRRSEVWELQVRIQ